MINRPIPKSTFFSSLADQLNQKHPLYRLSHKIDWQRFEAAFTPLYSPDTGRKAKPIRLMCGLPILKHVRNLSDESVVEQWSENAYYQYFCGMDEFTPSYPSNSFELVHFCKRIGEQSLHYPFCQWNHIGNQILPGEYDGHTIEESLQQVERITGRKIKCLAGDRGYRGRKEIKGTQILIPDTLLREFASALHKFSSVVLVKEIKSMFDKFVISL